MVALESSFSNLPPPHKVSGFLIWPLPENQDVLIFAITYTQKSAIAEMSNLNIFFFSSYERRTTAWDARHSAQISNVECVHKFMYTEQLFQRWSLDGEKNFDFQNFEPIYFHTLFNHRVFQPFLKSKQLSLVVEVLQSIHWKFFHLKHLKMKLIDVDGFNLARKVFFQNNNNSFETLNFFQQFLSS